MEDSSLIVAAVECEIMRWYQSGRRVGKFRARKVWHADNQSYVNLLCGNWWTTAVDLYGPPLVKRRKMPLTAKSSTVISGVMLRVLISPEMVDLKIGTYRNDKREVYANADTSFNAFSHSLSTCDPGFIEELESLVLCKYANRLRGGKYRSEYGVSWEA